MFFKNLSFFSRCKLRLIFIILFFFFFILFFRGLNFDFPLWLFFISYWHSLEENIPRFFSKKTFIIYCTWLSLTFVTCTWNLSKEIFIHICDCSHLWKLISYKCGSDKLAHVSLVIKWFFNYVAIFIY